MEKLLNEGELFLRTVSYFKDLECKLGRGDPDEGLSYVYHQQPGDKLIIGSLDLSQCFEGHIKEAYKDSFDQNVYCLHSGLTGRVFLKREWFGLGDTAILITKPAEFMRRVIAKLHEMKVGYTTGGVTYVDRATYQGEMGVFRKYSEFAFQDEFRIALHSRMAADFTFRIGPIADLAEMHLLADLEARIASQPSDESPQDG